MAVTPNELAKCVGAGARHELTSALAKIEHCLRQLDNDQVWQRPSESMNSIANLLLHLAGNVRQWIIAGVGGPPDLRRRQQEFDDRSHRPKEKVFQDLADTVDEAIRVLEHVAADELPRKRRVQGFDVTGTEAIFDSVAHFRGHAQEIVHMTRVLLGDRYEFDFVPNPEQE